MSNKIIQTCQHINCADILDKKFYPAWFFTNERINYFFSEIEAAKNIRNVFSIGGSGDFAFSLLSSSQLGEIDEIAVCDIRQMACLTMDIKTSIIKNIHYEQILDLFLKRRLFGKQLLYQQIRKTISPQSRKIIDSIFNNCKEDDFLECLKKSGYWYAKSFWQAKNRQDYLPYLDSKEKYRLLQNNLDKISIYCGDFDKNLSLLKDGYYDLVYMSNILDHENYCAMPKSYLKTVRKKLRKHGLLFVITQDNPAPLTTSMEGRGFRIHKKQLHRFSTIATLLGHFSYSFLLFRKS